LYNGTNEVLVETTAAMGDAPDNDNFVQTEISKEMLHNATSRQQNWIKTNPAWANYASYGTESTVIYADPDNTTYQGKFSLNRHVVAMARILAAYKSSGSLPAKFSSIFMRVDAYVPTLVGNFTRAALVDALAGAYAAWETTGEMPATITVNGTELNQVQYFYASAKVLQALIANNTSDIPVYTFLVPENSAFDTYDSAFIAVQNGPVNNITQTEDLKNVSERELNYALSTGNGHFPSTVSYIRDNSVTALFTYERSIVCFARAIAAYKTGSALPDKVSSAYLPEPEPTATTIGQFITGFSTQVLKAWEDSDTSGNRALASDISITIEGKTYNRGELMEGALRIVGLLNAGTTTLADAIPTIAGYSSSSKPTLENSIPLTTPEGGAGWDLVVNFSNRQLTYAGAGGAGSFANQVNYTANQVAGYGGYCALDRGTLIAARFFKHINDNNITADFATALASVRVEAAMK